ncbi:exonuclease SbcCD subunit D [Alkalibacillus haloalkaliphilus]|uniref:Nuclease SbcCD subunit D n=1 Tax=Alkalibacillus haloalkaliphilus TaxID=94136 RepID=A0A511W4G4_9BACI|nr:exonuclease SbcCD subunit D [Alkalibacillus haloalkaliphilus]GEN45996.1 nuclease SbcCD subunit D [Alkalibacillus haloalkaliphilus]
MKIFHTADWHLGKLVQGVYMTEDQRYILKQFVNEIKEEQPDVVIIAGDLYDRGVPPTDAVHLLNDCLAEIVLDLKIPVVAVAGNHDSPGRLNFGSQIMRDNGLHITGELSSSYDPVVINDSHGEVHFHLVPYCDPSIVRNKFHDEHVRSHHEATEKIVNHLKKHMDQNARHVFVGHLFVTPRGEEKENTSDSERPLSIGGAEHVDANLFKPFHYTALGHLHQAHHVGDEKIRYSGSPLKYSISEENHKKGYLIVEMDGEGQVEVEKRLLKPRLDLRTIEGYLEDLLKQDVNEDYVFVKLLDEHTVLFPMEQIRSVYPNAMHIEKRVQIQQRTKEDEPKIERHKLSDKELFKAFYEDVKGEAPSEEVESIMEEVFEDLLQEDRS